jgi:hypothetical protein
MLVAYAKGNTDVKELVGAVLKKWFFTDLSEKGWQ